MKSDDEKVCPGSGGDRGEGDLWDGEVVRWVEVGIAGGVHAILLIWKHNYQEKDLRFILIHECNAFNEEN